jgi:hypothetical protein
LLIRAKSAPQDDTSSQPRFGLFYPPQDPDHCIHLRAKSMTRVTSGHPSNINRITPDRHRLGHETGQNRVKPVIRSRPGHISHGYMKFTRKTSSAAARVQPIS